MHSADDPLLQGRRAYQDEAWLRALDALQLADAEGPLGPEDLELLARSAYMVGRDDEYVAALERAHQGYLDLGEHARAVRCGFWIGHSFLFRGERARATGWFARSQRVLDGVAGECVERGYLLIPAWLEQMGRGDFEAGHRSALEAAEIAERFGDADLLWLARDEQARALIGLGRVEEGLRLVDETLVAAAAEELSPIVTGIVYCNTISFCRAVHEVRHVREWTDALTSWCDRQPEMVAHNGLCLVHRAEIRLLRGDWDAALEEARRSAERFSQGALNRLGVGNAFYCQGEAHRLRGDLDAAEEAFRQASQHRFEPQPGLALLRLAQGNADAAGAAVRRVLVEVTAPLRRANVLPAFVDIMIATGSLESARAGSVELQEIADRYRREALIAGAARAQGAVALAEGDAAAALQALRSALDIWNELGAPYEVARVRVLVGLACRELADEDGALLELEAARASFDGLGAASDAAHVERLLSARAARGEAAGSHGLTSRELQVLRLVAAGKSNRQIARELFISEHTVARHVQNIFAKLAVTSRTAATAYAFEHQLV
jgi:DNA-binding CsgD family transcriptional regulator